MKNLASYLLHQIARFGSLRFPELQLLCLGRCKKALLYKTLSELFHAGLLTRSNYPLVHGTVYGVTVLGRQSTSGLADTDHSRQLKEMDVRHSLRVAETLLNLAMYEYVTGFATEAELSEQEWKAFSGDRRADGIVQVSRGSVRFELAVEVECTPKSVYRCEQIVKRYCEAFESGRTCEGVLFICDRSDIYDRYTSIIQQAGPNWSKQMLVLHGPGAPILKSELYGILQKNIGNCAEFTRNVSTGSVEYLPIFSSEAPLRGFARPTHRGGQSQNVHLKENLKPISQ